MNILILGGNGYIGSKVTRELVNRGHAVVCTKRINSDISRLDDIEDKIQWVLPTLNELELLTQCMKFDYILNFVCNYGRTIDLYEDTIYANLEFPLSVLNLSVKRGIRKFLTIGTGLPDELNMYSFSKKVFGDFGKYYANKHGVTFNNLLVEMFYGADEPLNRFFPSVITKMINGDLVETTVGSQRRDIIASTDIVCAVMMVVTSNLTGYHEISVGTGESPTISEVIDFIWEKTGRKSRVHKGAIPMRIDEPDCVADTRILCGLGNWNPIRWKDGMSGMIEKLESSALEV